MTADLRCTLLIMLVLASLGTAHPQTALIAPPATPLSVEQAVNFALNNNPTVTQAVQNLLIAQYGVITARANGLPTVSFNETNTWTPSPPTFSLGGANAASISLEPIFAASAQGTIGQPLWPSSRWRAPVKAARSAVKQSGEMLEQTREQTVFQTRQAFYQLLSARELQQVAKDALDVAQGELTLAQNTVKAGIAAPLDVYQAEAALADAQVNLARAQNTVDLSRSTLANQLGLPAETPVEIIAPAGLPVLPPEPGLLTQQALKNRKELQQINERRAQLRAGMELIRLQQQPLVNLAAIYAEPIAGASVLSAQGFSMTAVIAWALYNGNQTKAQLQAARVQLAQLNTSARQLELSIDLEVRQAWLNLQNALEQLIATDRQQKAAAEAFRIARIRYENGEGILLEEDQARLNYNQALTSTAQARFQAFTAAAALDLAVGVPAPAGK